MTHHPVKLLAKKGRAGEHVHIPPAGCPIAPLLFFMGHIEQQSAEQAAMDGLITRIFWIESKPAHAGNNPLNLMIDIMPLPHPDKGKVVVTTKPAHAILGLETL